MDTRKIFRSSVRPFEATANLTYRAEIVRRDQRGSSIYYDGGELAPYCIESLVDILRSEARTPHDQLDVNIELKGTCTVTTVRDLARRFGDLHEPRLHVRISAPGHPGVIIAPERSPSEPLAASTAGVRKGL